MNLGRKVYIVAAKRTPFGGFGGKLKDLSATQLAVEASKACIQSSQLPSSSIDCVIFGNVLQTSPDAAYLARHVGLFSGVPVTSPALTLNRLCGSGFQAAISGAMEILTGRASIVLVGGTESMSNAPFILRGIRWGIKFNFGPFPPLEDSLASSLHDSFPNVSMGITAENIAQKLSISRNECDQYAFSSHLRYIEAQKKGIFKHEIVPINIKGKKGLNELVETDESPRSDVNIESMASLKSVFKSDGVVTAANSSGITDGASALLLASEEAIQKYNCKPLARLVDWEVSGVDPALMGLGPVPSIQKLLGRHELLPSFGSSTSSISHIEINEAFAAQVLGVAKSLGLPFVPFSSSMSHDTRSSMWNPHGGAIALGHPLAASGARILTHLAHVLANPDTFPTISSHRGNLALGSACIGGGQGIAVLLARP